MKIIQAIIPKQRLYIMHFFIAVFIPKTEHFRSNSSEVILVAARFIPEFAKVIPNANIDIRSSKTPAPSLPKTLAIYTLKEKLITLISKEVPVKIIVLNKKVSSLFIY